MGCAYVYVEYSNFGCVGSQIGRSRDALTLRLPPRCDAEALLDAPRPEKPPPPARELHVVFASLRADSFACCAACSRRLRM